MDAREVTRKIVDGETHSPVERELIEMKLFIDGRKYQIRQAIAESAKRLTANLSMLESMNPEALTPSVLADLRDGIKTESSLILGCAARLAELTMLRA